MLCTGHGCGNTTPPIAPRQTRDSWLVSAADRLSFLNGSSDDVSANKRVPITTSARYSCVRHSCDRPKRCQGRPTAVVPRPCQVSALRGLSETRQKCRGQSRAQLNRQPLCSRQTVRWGLYIITAAQCVAGLLHRRRKLKFARIRGDNLASAQLPEHNDNEHYQP